MFKFLYFSIGLCTVLGFSQNNTEAINQPSIDQKLEYFLEITDTLREIGNDPGMAMAIYYNKDLIYIGTLGERNKENHLPVTQNTLFEIGSLTKAFTGVISSQLVQNDSLEWNDRVIDHIPEFKLIDEYAAQNATVIDLFTHKVGLDKHYYQMYGPDYERNQILDIISSLPFNGSFREKSLYNNFMYTVAGILEERITHKSWEELIKERIFQDLGMQNSYTRYEEFLKYENRTTSYKNDGETIIPPKSLETFAPSGSISSTINDMSIWLEMWVNSGQKHHSEFLKKSQFEYITSPLSVKSPTDHVFYGIGWEVDKKKDIIFHNGSTAGQRSRLTFNIEKGYGIVILTNHQSDFVNILDFYASNIFLKNKLERVAEADDFLLTRSKSSTLTPVEQYFIKDQKGIDQLSQLDGQFSHPAYGMIQIEKSNSNQFLFEYYDFKGTIEHIGNSIFIAHTNHFTGNDKFKFEIIETDDEKGLRVYFPYSKPLEFKKTKPNNG